jgi:hypothetical protein
VKPNLLQNVRSACKAVAEKANVVRIDYDTIPAYARSLPTNHIKSPELDPCRHYLGHGDDTVAFFLTLNAINFGSGYFPHLHKRPGMSGYFTVASSLNDYFKSHGLIGPEKLAELTVRECTEIFDQDPNNEPIQELMQHFTKAWNDLGRFLLDTFQGSFIGLVASADSSAERLVKILIGMPYFQDTAPYKNMKVPFYKRAQITAADLSTAFSEKGPGCFHDLDDLTIFADNLVPHVLRMDRLLIYKDALANRIDGGDLIPAGSPEEVEIRACAVHAVELIKDELRNFGHHVTSMGIDYLLWNRGQQPYYKSFPRHRTRSVFY